MNENDVLHVSVSDFLFLLFNDGEQGENLKMSMRHEKPTQPQITGLE